MKVETFELERIQSLWENRVRYNLTESGIHPYTVRELFDPEQIDELLDTRLGYGQTNGLEELREAISRLYPDTGIDNILVTSGSAEANFLAVWSLLEEGDELVLMLPNYMQIWGIARGFGVEVKPFNLREDLRWGPDLDELGTLVGPRTKMIAVCNPNNPTGAVLDESQMEAIVAIAERVGAWVYADEIYRGAELEGDDETPTFLGRYDRAIVAAGLSKAYALPGLRIGWLGGPRETIEDIWAHHDYTTISSNLLGNRLAAWALEPATRRAILDRTRKYLRENLVTLTAWADGHDGVFSFVPPRAGGIVFIRYDLPINSTELATRLREQQSVFIIAGDRFGIDHHIRIGIGAEKDYLVAGLGLIDEGLREIVER
jgi:aspartate/methionine/tyrosine aminotransferase